MCALKYDNRLDKKLVDIIGVASKYDVIKRVGIFGSFARGDNEASSDLDILYDYDILEQPQFYSTKSILSYYDEIEEKIQESFNIPKVDFVWYERILNSREEFVKNNILRDVIWLYEREK